MFGRIKIITVLAVAALMTSCGQMDENKKDLQQQTTVTDTSKNVTATDNTQAKPGEKVDNELVCMVNNKYMGKKQIEVSFDGKTYRGCCENCIEKIKTDETARTAKDPQTGEKVDKANAYIVLQNEDGDIQYFASEANYRAFAQKQS